jgi:hypothetical protein
MVIFFIAWDLLMSTRESSGVAVATLEDGYKRLLLLGLPSASETPAERRESPN